MYCQPHASPPDKACMEPFGLDSPAPVVEAGTLTSSAAIRIIVGKGAAALPGLGTGWARQ